VAIWAEVGTSEAEVAHEEVDAVAEVVEVAGKIKSVAGSKNRMDVATPDALITILQALKTKQILAINQLM
jgi:hypothetical protein